MKYTTTNHNGRSLGEFKTQAEAVANCREYTFQTGNPATWEPIAPIGRAQYRAARRSARDNGHRYAVSHADAKTAEALQRLHDAESAPDWLTMRQQWAQQPDGTTPANIVKLTSPPHVLKLIRHA